MPWTLKCANKIDLLPVPENRTFTTKDQQPVLKVVNVLFVLVLFSGTGTKFV
jgi:hypothetical protein